MAVAKISFQWLIRSEWVCRCVCELQLLYLDASQFPHSASANSTPLLIPFSVGVCSFTKWCHSIMQASLFLSTSMIWSDVSVKSHYMVYYYGSFLAHIVIIKLSKRLLLRPYQYSFIIHQVGGRSLRRDFSQRALRLGLRKRASWSHFPFSCFSSWDILMNQVVLGNGHASGCSA